MTAYYLIPTKWHPSGKAEMAVIAKKWDWIRIAECSHQKRHQAAETYERELNDGELFSIEKVNQGQTLFCVLPTPYNQARDYNSFSRWPCNQEGDKEVDALDKIKEELKKVIYWDTKLIEEEVNKLIVDVLKLDLNRKKDYTLTPEELKKILILSYTRSLNRQLNRISAMLDTLGYSL